MWGDNVELKKLLLRTGIITIGGVSIFSDNLKVHADEPETKTLSMDLGDLEPEYHGENLVRYYARVYELNEDTIVKKLSELTGNFSSYPWCHEHYINGISYKNEDLAILETVRDIYYNPSKYNLTYEEIQSDYEYITSKCHEELIEKYCNIVGVNKEIALAISYTECGPNLNSYNYYARNNPAGLGPHDVFLNIEQGICEYAFRLRDTYGVKEDSTNAILPYMGYCKSGGDWVGSVEYYYFPICDDYYCIGHQYGRLATDEKVLELK